MTFIALALNVVAVIALATVMEFLWWFGVGFTYACRYPKAAERRLHDWRGRK